jgi:hypothetical protein
MGWAEARYLTWLSGVTPGAVAWQTETVQPGR